MKFLNQLIIIIVFVLLWSCSTSKALETTTDTKTIKTIKVIEKDTLLLIEKDSSFYKAWIECKNDKPVIMEFYRTPEKQDTLKAVETTGRFLKPPNVKLNNNLLQVDCQAEAQELFVRWKEKHTLESKVITKTIKLPPIEVPRQLTWWQKVWITLGKVLAFGFFGFIISKVKWRNLFLLLRQLVIRR